MANPTIPFPDDPHLPSTVEEAEAQHEVYAENVQKFLDADGTRGYWRFFLDSYEGGRDWTENYLIQYARENANDYANRKKRAAYYNYCGPIVQTYNEFLFQSDPARSYGGKNAAKVEEWAGDVDGAGRSIGEYLAWAHVYALVYGYVWLGVDAESDTSEDAVLSQADETERGREPYAVLLHPGQATNWLFDTFGKLIFLRIYEGRYEGAEGRCERFLTWTRRQWVRQEVWTKLDTASKADDVVRELITTDAAAHGLGRVPFAVYAGLASAKNPRLGASLIRDIGFQNRQLNQHVSALDEFLHKQCFAQLFLPEGTLPKGDTASLGVNNAVELPADAQHFPAYVAPDTSPAQFLSQQIAWTVSEIYRAARLDNAAGSPTTTAPESGLSKAYDFERANRAFVSMAIRAERMERELVTIYALWRGWEPEEVDYSASYPRSFDVRGLAEQIESILSTQEIEGVPASMIRAALKRVADRMLPGLSPDEREEIVADIDAAENAGQEPGLPRRSDGEESPETETG